MFLFTCKDAAKKGRNKDQNFFGINRESWPEYSPFKGEGGRGFPLQDGVGARRSMDLGSVGIDLGPSWTGIGTQ